MGNRVQNPAGRAPTGPSWDNWASEGTVTEARESPVTVSTHLVPYNSAKVPHSSGGPSPALHVCRRFPRGLQGRASPRPSSFLRLCVLGPGCCLWPPSTPLTPALLRPCSKHPVMTWAHTPKPGSPHLGVLHFIMSAGPCTPLGSATGVHAPLRWELMSTGDGSLGVTRQSLTARCAGPGIHRPSAVEGRSGREAPWGLHGT